MESDESIKETPLPAVASPNQQVTGGDWDGLKKALTSSLTSGMFLDSQFYAVESRLSTGSLKIQPIYFCSTVGGSFGSKLVECKSHTWIIHGCVTDSSFQIPRNSRHGKHRFLDVVMGMTVILMMKTLTQKTPWSVTRVPNGSPIHPRFVVVNLAPSLQRPREPYTRKLVSGACTFVEVRGSKDVGHCPARMYILLIPQCSWSAIFLYVYAGQITFANICSQDVTSEKETRDGCSQDERKPPQDSGGLSTPSPGAVVLDPCSPKSIYCLANKVCLAPLLGDAITNNSFP